MHLIGFGMSLCAVPALALFVLPLGYLFLRLSQLADFDRRSASERLLWCVALGTPLAIITANTLEHLFSQTVTIGLMLIVALAAATLAAWDILRRKGRFGMQPTTMWACLIVGSIGLYLVLATIPVQSGDRIYESVAAGDWSVRVPLMDVAIHRGVPLVNPFYGIQDQTPPVRYYYYWYVLCGAAGHAFHLEARPLLEGSCVWAAWTLVASSFLLLKYLFRPRDAVLRLRKLCLLAVPVSFILGLDLPVFVAHTLANPRFLTPELDWWRASSDFSMSFHTAVLFAPHHSVGLASLFLCFLLLLPSDKTGLLGAQTSGRSEKLYRALASGLCAAALVGCSSYMALFLALSCLVVLPFYLRRGDLQTLWVMLAAGTLGVALSVPFLHEALNATAHATRAGQHAHAIHLAPRSASLSKDRTLEVLAFVGVPHTWLYELPLRIVFFVGYTAVEVGFFAYILYFKVREAWQRRRSLGPVEASQWALVVGIGVPALVLNSDTLAGVNDLGHHAGLALRLVAVLWATPYVARFIYECRFRAAVLHSGSGKLALAAVVLGLSAQVYQVLSQRFFFFAVEHRWTTISSFPFPNVFDTGEYYHDLYYGYRALLEPRAPTGRVLYNPTGRLNSAPMLYQTRFSVAPEPNCMTAFGGDIGLCQADMPAIQELFGGVKRYIFYPETFTPYVRESMTPEAFTQVCHEHHVATVIVSDLDPVWSNPDSFVWHMPVFFSSPRVRFLTCPTS